jgi:putative spermidine/putrescine transport system permease protein
MLKSITFGWKWPEPYPTQFNFRAWQIVVNDPNIIVSLKTTIIVGVSVVILNFFLAFPAAFALSRFDFKGKALLEAILFMPILIPVLVIAMGIHLTMIKIGLTDNISGVIVIHLLPTLPYAIRMLKTGYDRLNIHWIEQATSLGANKLIIFWTITFPSLLPSIRSTALLVFVISLSQYVLTAVIGGGQVITLPMIYYPYFNSADEAVIASFSIVFALLPILFLIVFEGFIRCYLLLIKRP